MTIKLVMTGLIGHDTQASITVQQDESWSVDVEAPSLTGDRRQQIRLSPEMIAELQGLLRRAGVGRKKKEKTDV